LEIYNILELMGIRADAGLVYSGYPYDPFARQTPLGVSFPCSAEQRRQIVPRAVV
jgi:hypothetical protein